MTKPLYKTFCAESFNYKYIKCLFPQDEKVEPKKGGVGVKGKIVGIFSRKNKKTDQPVPPVEKKAEKGWVTSEGTGQTTDGTGTVSTGMMTVLTKTNRSGSRRVLFY